MWKRTTRLDRVSSAPCAVMILLIQQHIRRDRVAKPLQLERERQRITRTLGTMNCQKANHVGERPAKDVRF